MSKVISVFNKAAESFGLETKALDILRVKEQDDGWKSKTYFYEVLGTDGISHLVIAQRNYSDGDKLHWHAAFWMNRGTDTWFFWDKEARS